MSQLALYQLKVQASLAPALLWHEIRHYSKSWSGTGLEGALPGCASPSLWRGGSERDRLPEARSRCLESTQTVTGEPRVPSCFTARPQIHVLLLNLPRARRSQLHKTPSQSNRRNSDTRTQAFCQHVGDCFGGWLPNLCDSWRAPCGDMVTRLGASKILNSPRFLSKRTTCGNHRQREWEEKQLKVGCLFLSLGTFGLLNIPWVPPHEC